MPEGSIPISASSVFRPCGIFRHDNETALAGKDPNVWRKLVRGDYTEHVVHMHQHGRVTAESVAVGYAEIAAILGRMVLI